MSTLGLFELTHPESLSESELKEILENRCIDFSNYKDLSRIELIELYKRVALPLPPRESESTQNSVTKDHNNITNVDSETNRYTVFSNGVNTNKRSINEPGKISEFSCVQSKCLPHESRQTPKKIRSCNLNNIVKCNAIEKRSNDGKQEESPSKKRQKITWP